MKNSRRQNKDVIRAVVIGAAVLSYAAPQSIAQTARQLEAHQHGLGTLDMAIEGQTLQAELEVPGSDIVGFEHAATTKSGKSEVAVAKKKLAQPSLLFAFPEEAGCRLMSADVSLSGEAEPVAGAQTREHGEASAKPEREAAHSEFRAGYTFTCSNVDAVARIAFPYFETFPNSEKLAVTLVTEKGQKAFEVNRKNIHADIRDMM